METKNYGLLKPTQDDFYDVEVFNANMDKIDNELKKRSTAMENVSDSEVEFVAAEVRENIKSGETLRIIFGKLAKLFADLKKVAFTGNYKDLSDKPSMGNAAAYGVANNDTTTEEGFVADARIVKTHGDEIDEVNSNLGNNRLIYSESEDAFYIQNIGADSVPKKLGSGKIVLKDISLSVYMLHKHSADGYSTLSCSNSFAIELDNKSKITFGTVSASNAITAQITHADGTKTSYTVNTNTVITVLSTDTLLTLSESFNRTVNLNNVSANNNLSIAEISIE